MHRIDGAGHVNNRFAAEDLATNRPPTEITAEWMNDQQESLCHIVEQAGIPLEKGNYNQLFTALLQLFGNFKQDGVGAVVRSFLDKNRESVSVCDFMTQDERDDARTGINALDCSASVQKAIAFCLANNRDLDVPYLIKLASSVNIDRLVDGAAFDAYFTIRSKSGGGFIVKSDTTMFSTALVNGADPNLPVSQLIRFKGIRLMADMNARAAYVLDQNKFLRVLFEACDFIKVKLLDAPAGKLTQSIHLINCNARRWSGSFFKSKEATFDLQVHGGLYEAGGDGFDVDFPVGCTIDATIEGMATFAVKYIGANGLTIRGYYEENGSGIAGGCSIDGSAGIGVDGSEAVSILGAYFSGDNTDPTKPQVKWGDVRCGISKGNICTTTLHSLVDGSNVNIDDYARVALANTNPKHCFRAHNQQHYGGLITQEFVAGRGGLLKGRSLQNNVESLKGWTVDENGSVGFGTDQPLAETHTHQSTVTKARHYMSNSTLGPSYGGFVSGYGVTGKGGYAAIGTFQNGVVAEAFIVDERHNLFPAQDNVQSIGTAPFRASVIFAGTGAINTSDERDKPVVQDIDERAIRAWGRVGYKQFKFADAIKEKGADGARWHFGLIAQRIKEAFEAEGLDPFAYGILCYDEWGERQEVKDQERGVVVPYLPAGSRYGVRYEEALVLECAYLRSRLA